MSYIEVLDSFEGMMEDDLKSKLDHEVEKEKSYHPFIAEVYESLREFVLRGGRRLAACSTLMVYQGYGGRTDKKILSSCSGVELYRHAILVHDDIVDKEAMRRGGPTLHRTFGEGYDQNLGTGTALFAGNILYSMALWSILESGFDPQLTKAVTGLLSSEYRAVNDSQILDLLFEYKEPGLKEWEVMASRRAASLFRASMLSGAFLAKASGDELSLLEDAARHIGFAFDIQDDIIDTFASQKQYGRVPCGDISKGKKPLHIVIALEKERRLASIMGKGGELKDEDEIKDVQDLIRDCGALDEAKSISRSHARRAEHLILSTGMTDEGKDFFTSFINYVDESLDWYR